jgi:hypothetical protein
VATEEAAMAAKIAAEEREDVVFEHAIDM